VQHLNLALPCIVAALIDYGQLGVQALGVCPRAFYVA